MRPSRPLDHLVDAIFSEELAYAEDIHPWNGWRSIAQLCGQYKARGTAVEGFKELDMRIKLIGMVIPSEREWARMRKRGKLTTGGKGLIDTV